MRFPTAFVTLVMSYLMVVHGVSVNQFTPIIVFTDHITPIHTSTTMFTLTVMLPYTISRQMDNDAGLDMTYRHPNIQKQHQVRRNRV